MHTEVMEESILHIVEYLHIWSIHIFCVKSDLDRMTNNTMKNIQISTFK